MRVDRLAQSKKNLSTCLGAFRQAAMSKHGYYFSKVRLIEYSRRFDI